MDLGSPADVNYLAVLIAALGAFGLGAVWYGPLFGKAWQREVGLSDADVEGANMALIFAGAFVLIFIATVVLALVIGPSSGAVGGAVVGLVLGAGLVSTMLGMNYLYQQQSVQLWLIDAGYMTLLLTVVGAILGAW
ncbi:MAG: DUF1761 domain-containing protein [Rubricoccaceae bacterium]|nr:DUF1761 domain-containing protein [Rubricoccaceae bacterium]